MFNDAEIGIQVGEILLPNAAVDLKKWAVIACDQFTSEPDYWQSVKEIVGDSPSTLNMILPEVYLNSAEELERIHSTQEAMRRYLAEGLFTPYDGLILVERMVDGKTRHGLMLALDLERYDFTTGSQSLIRATEGTIIERLPPRIRIREGAPLELPHILVLIDDPEKTVIEPLLEAGSGLQPIYDTELMLGSGHLRGALVASAAAQQGVLLALHRLADPQRFSQYYGVGQDKGVLLFAMGDGNHSLATAKFIWEKNKARVGMNHPSRYALVEVENIHDEGLAFEPIHRVLFGVRQDWKSALGAAFGSRMQYRPCDSPEEMVNLVNRASGPEQAIGVINKDSAGVVFIQDPSSNLPVGTLQAFLDTWMKQGAADQIDYVHGNDVVCRLGMQDGNIGFYLPAMDKNALFKTVILDGSLPRKTFSMGEAREKRFYMEARRIA